MKYIYFVSYWHTSNFVIMGFGNIELIRSAPITTHQETVDIAKLIASHDKIQSGEHVVILNFILLRTETEEEYLIRNA